MRFSATASFLLIAFAAPAVVSAQTVQGFLVELSGLISYLPPIAYGLAILFFFWGIAKYIFKAGSEEAKEEGKRIMLWGVIAIFVISSIWGIIIFLRGVFGLPQPAPPQQEIESGIENV